MTNSSGMAGAAGNFTGNYSEAVRMVSSPESAEQALTVFQVESSLLLVLVALAFVPFLALIVAGGALELYDDSRFLVLLLVELLFSIVTLSLVPFLLPI